MTSNTETAIKNLLAQSVGKNAAAPVLLAMKQTMAQNLSNKLREIAPNINFKQTFFPNQRPTALSNLVPGYTGMPTADWVEYVNVVLCQAIYYWTIYNTSLNTKLINTDVATYSAQAFANTGYIGAAAVAQNTQVAALAKVALDAGATKEDLVQEIIKIIPSRILLYQDGNWTNGDLEIFDWIGKYLAMGGTDAEISGLFTQFYNQGLPQFPNMTGATFQQYKGYLARGAGPTYIDFPELKAPVTYSKEICTIGCTGQHICEKSTDRWSGFYVGNAVMSAKYLAPSSCCAEDTEILMADGSSKLVRKLMPGDVIQGSSGPVTPLYVSTTPLSGRKLYEFFGPGEGPRLTDTHPVVNPCDSSNDADRPAVLAISPAGLRQILTNNGRTGVGPIIANETLVSVTNIHKGKDPSSAIEAVQALRETDTSDHGDGVYDIILPFSSDDQSGYWAGRNNKFLFIEPEAIRLKDDPHVGAAIFELIAGVATAYHNGEWTEGPGDDPAEMRQFFKSYGQQLFRLALKTALCKTSTGEAPPYEVEDIGPAIDAFISQSAVDDPTLVGDLAVVLEECSRHLYTPLSNVIRTGWRVFPQKSLVKDMTDGHVSSECGMYLMVTLMDLELTSDTHAHGAGNVTLTSTIDTSEQQKGAAVRDVITTSHSQTNNTFRHVYDHTIAYEMSDPYVRPNLQVEITLTPHGTPVATSTTIELQTDTYNHGIALLLDYRGEEVARLHFDVRRLTLEQMQAETNLEPGWGGRNQLAYAATLGRAMVHTISHAMSRRFDVMAKLPVHIIEV